MKKFEAKANEILSSTQSEPVFSKIKCREWVQHFQNGDFHVEDRHMEGERKFTKMQNWRHYLIETCIKRYKNFKDH